MGETETLDLSVSFDYCCSWQSRLSHGGHDDLNSTNSIQRQRRCSAAGSDLPARKAGVSDRECDLGVGLSIRVCFQAKSVMFFQQCCLGVEVISVSMAGGCIKASACTGAFALD